MNQRTSVVMLWMLACGLFVSPSFVRAEDPPAPPATSTYAPAADLAGQVDEYMAELTEGLASAEAYESSAQRVKKDANTLIVLAQALGMHDTENKYQAQAPAILQAAQQLYTAGDYEQAQAAFVELQAAIAGKTTDGPELRWEKIASLGQLMKQVTFVHNRLRRGVSERRFEDKQEENARYSALLAVIAQAALVDTHEVKDPAEIPQWYEMSAEMRTAAGEVNAQIHEGSVEGTAEAMKRLEKSCSDCHAVFRKDLL